MTKRIVPTVIYFTVGIPLWVLNSQTPATATVFFQGLGDLPGSIFSSDSSGVSADGSVVVGASFSGNGLEGEAFRWTQDTGIVGLGDLPGGPFVSAAFDVSGDGSIVVGASFSAASSSSTVIPPTEAFRWTAETGIVGLGDLEGGGFSSFASGISSDGSVIVGNSNGPQGTEAFRWTAETGLVGLGDLPEGGFSSQAVRASADGSVIVGGGISASGIEGFRWTEETGVVGVGDLPGGVFFSRAADVSADGSVIVGRSASANSSVSGQIGNFSGTEAFVWTEETGILGISDLPGGGFFSRAFGVSGDGSIVVGQSEGFRGQEPFIWDRVNGIRPLLDVLIDDLGLDLTGWTNLVAQDISDDNSTVIGFGLNPDGNTEGWIARLTPASVTVPERSSVFSQLAIFGVISVASALKRKLKR